MRTRGKARQLSRGRGVSAEEVRHACGGSFWAVGKHPPDCHDFRGALSIPFLGVLCLRALCGSVFFVVPAQVRMKYNHI